jgi:biotin operon repressor
LPIYCHKIDDENYYRFIAANLVENGLCTRKELATALGVNQKNIDRYVESLRSKGVQYFFNREDNRGQCYKLNAKKMEQAQEQLDNEVSVRQIARELQVTEAAIGHHKKRCC